MFETMVSLKHIPLIKRTCWQCVTVAVTGNVSNFLVINKPNDIDLDRDPSFRLFLPIPSCVFCRGTCKGEDTYMA